MSSYKKDNSLYKTTLLLLIIITIFVISYLFILKYNARKQINTLKKIESEIKIEKKNIRLLTVDYEHLSTPQAIKKLMFLTPDLQTIKNDKIIILERD